MGDSGLVPESGGGGGGGGEHPEPAGPGNTAVTAEIHQVIRERDHVTSMNLAQQKAIDRTRKLSRLGDVIRTNEGSWIIDECNRLRRENIDVRNRWEQCKKRARPRGRGAGGGCGSGGQMGSCVTPGLREWSWVLGSGGGKGEKPAGKTKTLLFV